jgi:hypothetical protein
VKVLVTGMTARQTKEDRTIAGALADVLRDAGHDVTVARPSLQQVLDGKTKAEYDHAFVGLGPLHGIGTSYKYGALGVIGAFWDDCTFFLDDVDTGKIGSGLKIMNRHNWKLTKPFYGYCSEFEVASKPKTNSWLLSVIDHMLNDQTNHPVMLTPAFTFNDAYRTAMKVTAGAAAHVCRVDWSVMSTSLREDADAAKERWGDPNEELPEDCWWSVEQEPTSAAVRSLGPFTWPVVKLDPKALETVYDSTAYLAPGQAWNPRFYQVAKAGLPQVAPWRFFRDAIGDSFEVLSGTIEGADADGRKEIASEQLAQLERYVMSRNELSELTESVMLRDYVSLADRSES